LQSTVGGKVGEFAGALPLAFVPGANTYGGAAALGGLFGAAEPTTQGESALLNTGIGAATGVAGKWGGDKLGSWLTDRAKAPFMGWSPSTATRVAAEAVGSDSPKLNQPAVEEATSRIGDVFNQARSPNVSMTPAAPTLNAVTNLGNDLNKSTRSAFENNDNVSDLLDYALNNKPATAAQLGQISSKLGSDARTEMTTKTGDRALGSALFTLQDHVDDLVGSTITDPALQAAYPVARQQYRALSQLTTNPSILNSSTGQVNMTALGKYLQRTDKPGYLRGGNQSDLYNAARWGQATGEGPGAPPFSLSTPWKLPLYAATHNPASRALGGVVSRAGAPVAPIAGRGAQGLLLGSTPDTTSLLNGLWLPKQRAGLLN